MSGLVGCDFCPGRVETSWGINQLGLGYVCELEGIALKFDAVEKR